MNNKKHTILYVDDEESNLRVFRSTFRRDFSILTTSTGEDALRILDQNTVDVLITDQRMPKMTGTELLKELKKRNPGTPPSRLILSAYSKPEDIDLASSEYRLLKFIKKPWKETSLKNDLLNAIEANDK